MVKQAVYKVEGMSCQGCANAVTNVLNDVAGVSAAVIDLSKQSADVTFDETVTYFDIMRSAIDEAGYSLSE